MSYRTGICVCFLLTTACGAGGNIATGDEQDLTEMDPALKKAAADNPLPADAAALANLKRIAKELDAQHLANYTPMPDGTSETFADEIAESFLAAVKLEYQAKPEMLQRRVQMLASMVFFSAPEVITDPAVGHVTPFHGMNAADFERLMTNEDVVFTDHMSANGGSPNGVRPFSVCETKFLIDISTNKVADAFHTAGVIHDYQAYALAYQAYAAGCEPADLTDWYNFRGLGGLRPSWLESNYNDRVLRKMLKRCKAPQGGEVGVCETFQNDRLAYRDRKNVAMALRQMVFDTSPDARINGTPDEDYMTDPNRAGVFIEDQNGDNVAEWLAPGSVALNANAKIKVDTTTYVVGDDEASLIGPDGSSVAITNAFVKINSTGKFTGELALSVTLANAVVLEAKATPAAVKAVTHVMPGWKPDYAMQPDLGLETLFAEGDCSGDRANPTKCPLIKRFYSLIDRHENFYQTYSTLETFSANVSSQPSPLVACSITLRASHHWDKAGTPDGGVAGFIYLMRIPFNQILSGDVRSIDTLGRLKGGLRAGPAHMELQAIRAGQAHLDMTQVWLDIATLSNNKYATEHEISKFGTVPATQIEGVLVIRRPAAMGPDTSPPDQPNF